MTSQKKFWTAISIVTVNLGLAIAWYFKSNYLFENNLNEGWIAVSFIIPVVHLTALCVIGALLSGRQLRIAKSFFFSGVLVFVIEVASFFIIVKMHGEKLWTSNDELYQQTISSADKQFSDQYYDNALTVYILATSLKTDEQYPKDQIKKCRQLINERQQRQHLDSLQKTKYISPTDSNANEK
jgi:predicted DNA-binding protein YlxM (UPF0122 family)